MFDLNALISAALNTAATTAITPLLERITALEINIAMMQNSIDQKDTRIAALEAAQPAAAPQPALDKAALIDYLNEQEWFWEKMQRFAAGAAEAAMDDHTSTYDHDSYDSAVSTVEDTDFDGLVTNDNIDDAVREAVGNLSFEVSVS